MSACKWLPLHHPFSLDIVTYLLPQVYRHPYDPHQGHTKVIAITSAVPVANRTQGYALENNLQDKHDGQDDRDTG